MKRTQSLLAVLLVFMVAFSSCDPDKPDTNPIDEKAPSVMIMTPAMVEPDQFTPIATTYASGDSVGIEVLFRDNVALKDYTIKVAYEGDLYFLKKDADPLDKTFIGNLNGSEQLLQTFFFVDFDPYSGPYSLTVSCRDMEGFETTATTYFVVQNGLDPLAPNIALNTPSLSMVDTFAIGEWININGTISDNREMTTALIRVRNTFTKEMLPDGTINIDFAGATSYNLDTSIYVTPTVPGDYDLEILALDTTQNLGKLVVPIFIETNN